MSKVERLLNLTMALLETPRPLTANELRERIPGYPDQDVAFRRAFARDKDTLREMGIPLTISEVPFSDPPADGYRITKAEYYLRDPGFEPDELAALHLAASAVRLDARDGREALWKLGGAAPASPPGPPAEGPDPATEALVELPNDPNLAPLFSAAVDRRPATFGYRGRRRRVDPYRLDFRRGRWYLSGYDHTRAEERNFRVDRIEGTVELGRPGAFERPATAVPGGPAEPWQFREEDPVTARLAVDAGHAAWVRHHLSGATIVEERPDGGIVVEVVVTNWSAFRSFVLTFLEHAEILGPPDLRADLIRWLEAQAGAGAVPAPAPAVPPARMRAPVPPKRDEAPVPAGRDET